VSTFFPDQSIGCNVAGYRFPERRHGCDLMGGHQTLMQQWCTRRRCATETFAPLALQCFLLWRGCLKHHLTTTTTIVITIVINSWFSAPPTARMMTHYTVQFNSAIPELTTVTSLEQ